MAIGEWDAMRAHSLALGSNRRSVYGESANCRRCVQSSRQWQRHIAPPLPSARRRTPPAERQTRRRWASVCHARYFGTVAKRWLTLRRAQVPVQRAAHHGEPAEALWQTTAGNVMCDACHRSGLSGALLQPCDLLLVTLPAPGRTLVRVTVRPPTDHLPTTYRPPTWFGVE